MNLQGGIHKLLNLSFDLNISSFLYLHQLQTIQGQIFKKNNKTPHFTFGKETQTGDVPRFSRFEYYCLDFGEASALENLKRVKIS